MRSERKGVLPESYYHIAPKVRLNQSLHYYLAISGHFWCEKGYFIKRHYYKYMLLTYILKGEMKLEYQNKQYVAKEGDAVFIDCHNLHHYSTDNEVEFYFVYIGGGQSRLIFEDLYAKYGPVLRGLNRNKIKNSLHYILYCQNNDKFPLPMEMSNRVYGLLCDLYPYEEIDDERKLYQAISPVFEHIRYNLSTPLTTEEMAESVHMSRSYFSRSFRKITGQSPHDYLIKLRMELAKQLLADTNMTIKEIARTVGYESEVGFIAAFTKKVLTTPTRYRKAPW